MCLFPTQPSPPMSGARRVLVLFTAVLVAGAAHAQDAGAKGSVDWEKKVLRASGQGAPDLRAPNIAVARLGAERAAKIDAMRNLLETLKGVNVESGSTAGGIMDSNSSVKAGVQGVLRNFKVVDTRYFSDGGVEVDVEMKLDGELAAVLLGNGEKKALPSEGKAKYTGLIVDASGKKPDPALAPRIVDDKGGTVYGAEYVAQDAVKERGVVAYGTSLDDAKKNPRVGENPLVVKAMRAEGSDLVLASADAAPLVNKDQNLSFLGEGRVLIVTD